MSSHQRHVVVECSVKKLVCHLMQKRESRPVGGKSITYTQRGLSESRSTWSKTPQGNVRILRFFVRSAEIHTSVLSSNHCSSTAASVGFSVLVSYSTLSVVHAWSRS